MEYDENAEKYGYEGEMTPLKCDELKAYKGDVYIPVYGSIADADVYLKKDVDAAIAELKDVIHELQVDLEGAKATAYADSADAGMRERKLKHTLWVTRTAMAKSEKDRWNSQVDCGNKRNRKDPAYVKVGKLLEVSEWRKLWADNESKCRAKAEEYK